MSGNNPVGWFEIYVQDMARAKAFYQTVLGLALTPVTDAGMDMQMFPHQTGNAGASGALVRMDGMPSGGNSVLVYFMCADCAVEAARVPAAGGKVFKEKFAIGQYGHIALAVDPDGNMFGLHSMQ